ncbi:hypothetical protein W02_26100 [Nitrospira sp. KM1]|uniref:hypothetical protein n=1 Tax=Nitrospira sp. KM1 TaxID=1936990 RepID=UPI0013A78B9A|nr:hypothetical protein [Nitrospira sp. KM1]BCA55470.1 hypothetical protein W02_26100 [Nitrospira sp. KM1]
MVKFTALTMYPARDQARARRQSVAGLRTQGVRIKLDSADTRLSNGVILGPRYALTLHQATGSGSWHPADPSHS